MCSLTAFSTSSPLINVFKSILIIMDVRRMEDFQTNGIFVLNARKFLTRMICVIILVEECQRCHRVFFGESCYQDDKKPSNPKGNSIYQILNNVPSAEYHKKKTERRGN